MKKRNRQLVATIFLFWFSLYTYPSFLSSYIETVLGATSVMVGLIVGSYGFTQMLLRVPLGIISDITGSRKKFVLAGFAASVIASAGLSGVAVFAGYDGGTLSAITLIMRGMSGVAASSWVCLSVFYSSSFPPENTSDATSKMAMPQYLSQIIAMLIGPQIMTMFGAEWAFLTATLAGIVGFVTLMGIDEEKTVSAKKFALGDFAKILKNKGLITGTLISTLMHLVAWATVLGFVQNWASDFVKGFTPSHLGLLSVMYLIPNAVFPTLVNRRLSRIIPTKTLMAAGFILIAASCLIYPMAKTVIPLMLNQFLFGVGMSLIIPFSMATAIRDIPEAQRGAAMGVYQAVYGLGMFIGPVIAGAVIEKFTVGINSASGYVVNFRLCACAAVIGIIAAILSPKAKTNN